MVDEKVYVSLLKEILAAVREKFGSELGPVERGRVALAIMAEMAEDRRINVIADRKDTIEAGGKQSKL